jgi:hypothetical protein
MRVATSSRNASWIYTEYNNQSSPSTFYSVGSEVSAGPTVPDATAVTYTTGGDGAISSSSITVTGTNFGAVATSSAATCNGGAGTGCIQFIAGGNATVASASIASWSNTSIVFTVSSTLASNGGTSSLQVWAANASDTTPLTFYIYPNIKALASLGTNAAREYNAADTDGLIMLSGDHFGAAGTSTILGSAATQHNSTGGSCTVGGYASATACFEVPTGIASNLYSGTVILTRTSDGKQATTTLSILPRITGVSPASTSTGNVVQLLGDHFCQGGTCPVTPNRSTSSAHTAFSSTWALDSDFMNQTGGGGTCNGGGTAWTSTEICVKVPVAAATGSMPITTMSNSNSSNAFAFTVSTIPAPSTAPGNPSYGSIGSSTVSVSWTAATSSVSYGLERATSSQSYQLVVTTSSLTYLDTGLTPNTSFFYMVYGANGGGNGPTSASTTVLLLPDVPGIPSYGSVQSSSLTVNWTAPVNGGAPSYKLERATSSQSYQQISSTTSLSYNDSGLASSTTFYYRVRATNAAGNGAYGASSSVTTSGINSPPNAPSEDLPASGGQGFSTTPVFKMTATDPNGDKLQYKVTIYSGSSCSGVVQTDDQSVSQSGWTGQNTTCVSGSDCYTSGSQGTYTVQSALSANATYYWRTSAKDPLGSNTWTDSAACGNFMTSYNGSWAADSGGWSISSNQLTVSPGTGNYTQLHLAGQNILNAVIEFQVKASGGSTGDSGALFRADSGSNRYLLGDLDYVGQHKITKTISSAPTILSSAALALFAGTFYEVRGSLSGSSQQSWVNGATALSAGDGALGGAGFVGFGASGNNAFTYDDFAVYSSTIVTLSNLPGGGSWSVLNHAGAVVSCLTGSTWNASTYTGQVPVDYDAGGGQVAVWSSNNTCSGSSTATYPSASGFATDIFGGDTYLYSPASSGTTGNFVVSTSTTITVSAAGLISD